VNPDNALRRVAIARDWPVLDFARPVAMRSVRQRLVGIGSSDQLRAVAGVAAVSVALGAAWYAARHRAAG
jgi:hypothetical protein